MKSSIKLLLYILLFFVTPQVFAGPFDPPPTDQSVNLLGVIFGDSVGGIYLGGRPNPALSGIMEKFNFIMVVVGIVVVSYVAVLSTINTAHQGTAMGKKWSAVWIPMRSVAGMALMVPAPASGYSMIQVTVMWIILQGIGAADTLWNIALDGLSSGVSATVGTVNDDPSLDATSTNIKALVQQISDAAICMQTLYAAATLPENVQSGSWVSQHGQYIKNFSIQNPNTPSISGAAGNANKPIGNRVAKVTGNSYFGVNDTSDPGAMSICGKLKVQGVVDEAKDFKNSTVGSYTIPDADLMQMAQLIYDTKIKAISSMLFVLNPMAEGLVSGQYSTKEYSATTGLKPPAVNPPPKGYNLAAANAYSLAMKTLVVPMSAIYGPSAEGLGNNVQDIGGALLDNKYTSITDNSDQTQAIIDAGRSAGWVTAGSFYFVFNKTFKGTLFQSALPNIDPVAQDPSDPIPTCDANCRKSLLINSGLGSSLPQLQRLQNKQIISNKVLDILGYNLANSSNVLQSDTEGMPTSLNFPTAGSGSSAASQALGLFNSSGAQIITAMTNVMHDIAEGNGGDPLLAHALFGRYVMLSVEGAFLGMIALIIVTSMGSAIPFIGPVFATIALYILGFLAILSPLFGILWAMGAMLAIYCPLIPYMIFTMGVVGWLLVVIEAVVAAPIIALGLVMPSEDEMGKVGSALTILANIFLRPMLMIFGFLLASSLYKAVVQLIDFGMADIFKTIAVGTIFSVIMVLTVYTTFIVSVTNICFSLIYAIPDKILRWIGGGGEHTDVSNIDEVKGKAQSTADGIGGGIREGVAMAGKKNEEGANNIVNKGATGIRDTAKALYNAPAKARAAKTAIANKLGLGSKDKIPGPPSTPHPDVDREAADKSASKNLTDLTAKRDRNSSGGDDIPPPPTTNPPS